MELFLANPEKYRLNKIPSTVHYIPEFITEDEENAVINRFYEAPKPKWTQLMNRRLQNWGGIPHPKGMIAEPIPGWLQIYLDKINKLDLMNGKIPNHILANEYASGQGIMPHTDGPLFYPTITTITCGSHAVINFEDSAQSQEKSIYSVLLERRSLFIVQNDMYENYKHGIDEIHSDELNDNIANMHLCSNTLKMGDTLDRKTRISLTIRHVPKTTKIKIKL